MSLLRAIYENNCSNVRKAIESQPQSVFEVDGVRLILFLLSSIALCLLFRVI